jgi:hypothetical protein
VFPVRYELGFHIPEDDILHSHRRENVRSYISKGRFSVLQMLKNEIRARHKILNATEVLT